MEVSVLAIVETVLAMIIYVLIAAKWGVFHLLVALFSAPLLLFRTDKSQERAIRWVSSWRSHYFSLGGFRIRAHTDDDKFWFPDPRKWGYVSLILANYALVEALLFFVCRIVATIATVLQHPILSFREIPNNWWRQVACLDSCHPVEPLPGMSAPPVSPNANFVGSTSAGFINWLKVMFGLPKPTGIDTLNELETSHVAGALDRSKRAVHESVTPEELAELREFIQKKSKNDLSKLLASLAAGQVVMDMAPEARRALAQISWAEFLSLGIRDSEGNIAGTKAWWLVSIPILLVWAILLFPALVYRWSIKGTAILWSPLIFLARASPHIAIRNAANDIRYVALYRLQRWYGLLAVAVVGSKIFLAREWSTLQQLWQGRPVSQLLDSLLAPEIIPIWQVAQAMNGALSWVIYLFADFFLHRLQQDRPMNDEFADAVMRIIWLIRGILTVYTLIITAYVFLTLAPDHGLQLIGSQLFPPGLSEWATERLQIGR